MNNGLMSTDYDTLTISASNSADYIYTNTGTGTSSMATTGIVYTPLTTGITTQPYIYTDTTSQNQLYVKGNAVFEGDITLQGMHLSERLDKIEERLGILHPNKELENRWSELKELGARYKALEKEILEKEKVWKILQK